ncbi:HNH endonuclease [Dulcicalothrix desertica]|uniref:HNH endonuclease n=1 Tax=Dulcicalothrix desertica TaxID=32056 RepID=UPI001F47414E|nr:HNH endonuclease [Dulcicalothrix desertica]
MNRSLGTAPNKPILLLSIIELISRGEIRKNQILLSGELVATFMNLWRHLEPTRKPDIGQPFFYLRSDGFWHFQPNPGFELAINSKAKLVSAGAIKQAIEYAYLDDKLWQILQDSHNRSVLIQVLIDEWFSGASNIEGILQVNAFAELQEELERAGGKIYQPSELDSEQKIIVRDAAFRKIVTATYNFSCAFCGHQILDINGQGIVDGAHILPFSKFYDDKIDNGLALCKTHHWAFDRGWFSIEDDYSIIVMDGLREQAPNCKPMHDFVGEQIMLPAQTQYYPRVEALKWHRENIFNAA